MAQKNGSKERLDVLMVARGLAESREQAKRLVLAGQVEIAGSGLPKPGQLVSVDAAISLKAKERFVSRGGLKLEEALEKFGISVEGKICADIGASTGGFTDCMLQHGARTVYSVDVGATQMHERLRADSRVVLLEHTNAKNLTAEIFAESPEFVAVDVSFISVLKISASLRDVMVSGGEAVILIKPQFEAGREIVSRGKGVIRDPDIHRNVLVAVIDGLLEQGWGVKGLIKSPIEGGSGNKEFLCWLSFTGDAGLSGESFAIDDVL